MTKIKIPSEINGKVTLRTIRGKRIQRDFVLVRGADRVLEIIHIPSGLRIGWWKNGNFKPLQGHWIGDIRFSKKAIARFANELRFARSLFPQSWREAEEWGFSRYFFPRSQYPANLLSTSVIEILLNEAYREAITHGSTIRKIA